MAGPLLDRLHVYRLSGTAAGKIEVTCGRCLRDSPHLAEGTKAEVWAALEALGWIWYVPPDVGGYGYAVCGACAVLPPDDLSKAHAGKKRRR